MYKINIYHDAVTTFVIFNSLNQDSRSSVRLKWDGISRAHAWVDLPLSVSTGVFELVCNGSGNGIYICIYVCACACLCVCVCV